MEMTKKSEDRMQTIEGSYLSILGFKKELDKKLGKDWLFKCRKSGEVAEEEGSEYNKVIHSVCRKEISRYILLQMDTEYERREKVTLLYMNFPLLHKKVEAKIGKDTMWQLKRNEPDCEDEICRYNLELKKFFHEKIVQFTI